MEDQITNFGSHLGRESRHDVVEFSFLYCDASCGKLGSTWANQTSGLVDQNGGIFRLTATTAATARVRAVASKS